MTSDSNNSVGKQFSPFQTEPPDSVSGARHVTLLLDQASGLPCLVRLPLGAGLKGMRLTASNAQVDLNAEQTSSLFNLALACLHIDVIEPLSGYPVKVYEGREYCSACETLVEDIRKGAPHSATCTWWRDAYAVAAAALAERFKQFAEIPLEVSAGCIGLHENPLNTLYKSESGSLPDTSAEFAARQTVDKVHDRLLMGLEVAVAALAAVMRDKWNRTFKSLCLTDVDKTREEVTGGINMCWEAVARDLLAGNMLQSLAEG